MARVKLSGQLIRKSKPKEFVNESLCFVFFCLHLYCIFVTCLDNVLMFIGSLIYTVSKVKHH